METDQNSETILKQGLTRRQVIRAGGIAAVGLAFTKPLIETIYPKPAFANYVLGGPSIEWAIDDIDRIIRCRRDRVPRGRRCRLDDWNSIFPSKGLDVRTQR